VGARGNYEDKWTVQVSQSRCYWDQLSQLLVVGGFRKVVVGEVKRDFQKAWHLWIIDFLISVDYLPYYE